MTKTEATETAGKVLALPEPTRTDTLSNILLLMHDAEETNRQLRVTLDTQTKAMAVSPN